MQLKKMINWAACVILLAAAVYAVYPFVQREVKAPSEPASPVVNIGDYVFSVEDAVGDSYNVRIRYSLRRQDGKEINPEMQFEVLDSEDKLRSSGASLAYSVSQDRKTIWIVEEKTSSSKFHDNMLHTVTLENLTFGEDSDMEPIKGTWQASCRIPIQEECKEFLNRDVKIQDHENPEYDYQVSSVQLLPMGIHMVMEIPHGDASYFMDHFHVNLVLEDGTILYDVDKHASIREKKATYQAVVGVMLDEQLKPEELHSVVICGYEIMV